MLQPIATLIVGLAVAFIAVQQWMLARDKFRLDLFDKRYKVYEAARNFLAGIVSKPDFDNSQLFAFYIGIAEAEFLFDTDVVTFLGELRHQAIDMRTMQKLHSRATTDDELSRLAVAEDAQLLWLTEQLKTLGSKFVPYMGFKHIKAYFLFYDSPPHH